MNAAELARRAVKAGLIAGITIIYLSLVGMIEKFDVRNLIGDTVTLGRLLLGIPPFLAAYLVVRPRVRGGELRRPSAPAASGAGTLAGLAAGLLTGAALALVHAFPDGAVRNIFVSVSPPMLEIVSFGRSLPLAMLLMAVGGAALGAVGGGYGYLPERYRRPLTVGLLVTFVVALLQRIIPTMLYQLDLATGWLYSTTFGGLTVPGAVLVFAVSAALAALWRRQGPRLRRRVEALPPPGRRSLSLAALAAGAVLLLLLPFLLGTVLSQVLGTVGIYLLMGLGLNIVVGYAGLLDLGYVAFFAAGAYLTALLTGAHVVTSLGAVQNPTFSAHLNFYAAVPLVILLAAFIGLLIGVPVLRLRGDYLAIVTLGFGEIVRVLVTSDWLQHLLGGAQGLRDVTDAPIGSVGFQSPEPFYFLVLAFVVLAVYMSRRLAASRVGRAWSAMREDELAAETMGISTVKYKLLAFAMGAGIGCLSGAMFAVQIGSLAPTSFDILVSITALAVVILGGMGSIPGVIVGALVLIGLPGFLDEFEEFRLLIYGAVLIGIMILRPQGLVPNVRRMRELHEEDVEQDQWLREQAAAAAPGITVGGDGGAP